MELCDKSMKNRSPRADVPDDRFLFWGSCFTKVSRRETHCGEPFETMSHELSSVVSGAFRGSCLKWSGVSMVEYAIVATLKR